MAYTDIDCVNGRTIRKLHSPNKAKVFGYLSGIKNPETKDLTEVQKHDNLTAARIACGFVVKETPKTLPKSAYAQNRKGFHANGSSGKKG